MRSIGLEEHTRRGACRSRPRITGARCARSSAARDDQGLTGQPRCRDAAGLGWLAEMISLPADEAATTAPPIVLSTKFLFPTRMIRFLG